MKRGTQYTEVDNVATCLEDVSVGDVVHTDFTEVTAVEPIQIYHKVALVDIAKDANVYKYGEIIGIATEGILAGGHVHVHNVESTRGRGDKK